MKRKFNFDLYRLNVVDVADLFVDTDSNRLREDSDVLACLSLATQSKFDEEQLTRNSRYIWSVRNFQDYSNVTKERELCSILLARSLVERDGLIVTDRGLSEGHSTSHPPLASAMMLFFDLSRHLVAVEHTGDLSQTAWKDFVERIIEKALLASEKASSIELEPVPERYEITELFKSFERITRLKATLRIPNPELTRYTKSLYDDLVEGNVREYTQDMKNPNGLSQTEEARPYATASLAELGYKRGDIQIEGYRDQEFEVVKSGSNAARGTIQSLRDFVRGLSANAKAKETKAVLDEISKEIDRIHPVDEQ